MAGSWAHEDMILEMRSQQYESLTPQEKMARCKQRRRQQIERWIAYDSNLTQTGKLSFKYHKPRRRIRQDKTFPQRPPNSSVPTNSSGSIKIIPDPSCRFLPNIVLLDAVNRGDLEEVEYHLQNSADPNGADEDGLTALHQACIDNYEEIVKVLLENGSFVDCRDSEDWTPLHACTTCGHINIAQVLLDAGADILAVNADLSMPYDICEDDSPMLEFIENSMEKRKISQEQINARRAQPEQTIIRDVKENMLRNQKYLNSSSKVSSAMTTSSKHHNNTEITSVNSINVPYNFNEQIHSNPDKCTLLHISAANGYLELAKILLTECQVDPNSTDKDGWTSAHACCCWSQKEVLSLIIEHGGDLNRKNNAGEKPIAVTDDRDMINFVNRLIREQRQRRRANQVTNSDNQSTKFSRSAGSRRSARSQSFRRRSIRKGNTAKRDETSGTVSGEEPHAAEAREEAAFWRGEVVVKHAIGESSSSSDTTGTIQQKGKQKSPDGVSNGRPPKLTTSNSFTSSQQRQVKRAVSNPKSPVTSPDRIGNASGVRSPSYNSPQNSNHGNQKGHYQGQNQRGVRMQSPVNSISNTTSPSGQIGNSPAYQKGTTAGQRNKKTTCCVVS